MPYRELTADRVRHIPEIWNLMFEGRKRMLRGRAGFNPSLQAWTEMDKYVRKQGLILEDQRLPLQTKSEAEDGKMVKVEDEMEDN
jgi:hypothetical protein